MLRVSIFGLGYVGCVSAACLARAGHQVVGVETNEEKAALINAGRSPIVEPGLGALLAEVVKGGKLRATLAGGEAVAASDLALICVGTPSRGTGQLDTDALVRVGEEIGCALRGRSSDFTVVLRSTVLPGTVEEVLIPALRRGADGGFKGRLRVAMNPEFMREGSALKDFAAPPLTLVGCEAPETAYLLESLYRGVNAPFVFTSVRTAEMAKYAANTFHALKVCFANEIGDACAALGADAQEVMRIFRMDRKLNVSEAYLRPGFAFGGSCLPKDLRALIHASVHADVPLPLLSAILPSNEAQIQRAANTVLALGRRRIGVVGLAFKPGTDDLRESPMVRLVEILIGKGCRMRIFDRNVSVARLTGANRRYIEEEIPHIASLMCEEPAQLLEHSEVVVVGGAGEEAAEVLEGLRPEQTVIDLTRGAARRLEREQVEA
jgi:GDP-mannose 6-dehydrogenase